MIYYDTTYTTHAFTASPYSQIFPRLHRRHPRDKSREPSACINLRCDPRERDKRTSRRGYPRSKRGKETSIWRSITICTRIIFHHITRHTRTRRNRNNAQHSLSHYDHDGQHLLSAAGSRDADGHGNGHGAELFVLLASRHPQPCPRILCQLGLLLTQEKGKSYCLMSQKCGAAQYDLSLRKSELTWLVCSHA